MPQSSAAHEAAHEFATLDWIVLCVYAIVLIASGVLVSLRRNRDTSDYFLAGRSMPTWAVTISIIATSLSAATFIGGPQQAYVGNLTYLSASIGGIIAALVVAFLFLPAFYQRNVATVYELLEHRGGPTARLAASVMFMLGRILASGARLFIASLAASLIAFGDTEPMHLVIGITVFTLVGVAYTLIGGVASVIWTDVIQFIIFIGAVLIAGYVLLERIPVDSSQIVEALQNPDPDDPSVPSKLTVIEIGASASTWNHTYTLLTAIFGFSLFNIAAYGTDQDLTQRMLTCKSADRGSRSIIAAIVAGVPITLLFMLVGLLLFIFYQRPDLMNDAAPAYAVDDSRKIFLTFIMEELPAGLAGLMMAGLFAAGLSSLNSALNAMASAFTSDFYKRFLPSQSERQYLLVGRLAVAAWGIALGSFAILCVFWQKASGTTLIDFALGVMTFAYSGLLGVFLTVLLTRSRGNVISILGALLVGFVTVFIMRPIVWHRITPDAWNDFTLAFPWQMVVASGLAFVVCLLGKSNHADDVS